MICDMGADAVIACHTHCPQGYEIYNNKPIVYSMGNFLFKSSSPKPQNDSWYYGYLCELDLSDRIEIRLIPYRFDTDALKINVFSGTEKEKMTDYITRLSGIIADSKMLSSYYNGWSVLHPWCPSLPINNDLASYNSSGNFNLISCEAHCDQLRSLLEIYHKDIFSDAILWSEKIKELMVMPV